MAEHTGTISFGKETKGKVRLVITDDSGESLSLEDLTKETAYGDTLLSQLADQSKLVTLFKPQFEVGSEHVNKGGVVRDQAMREQAVGDVQDWVSRQEGWTVDGVIGSPIAGGSGNIESLLGARKLG